ncbi:hypothetical protein LTR37_011128 [Vermiconidia calcicola]|uniref:Uncharacterized protein n=1 Tax=Vermiconidia calcicola TaxID=1690605 RepID=A0ACC3N380_9PEZI|nr:hypothetical protein LTR37_011128 [Vermiconidia calcicola]
MPIRNPYSREKAIPNQWRLDDPEIDESWVTKINSAGNHSYLATKRSHDMLHVSRIYFDRAIDGHRKALEDLTVENIEAVYCTSVLVSFHALFVLSESEEDSTLPSLDPVQWLRLGKGTRFICSRWKELVGPSWINSSGVSYGLPSITNESELFNSEHGKPFKRLLTWAEDFETIHPEDRKLYEQVISYVGMIYKCISEGNESELAICRRLVAMPSRNDPRFIDMVEAKRPPALAILAHLFACMKLIDNKVPWFRGIAERQVPKIHDELPVGWRPMLAWPMAITAGEVDREPAETQIEDILAL